MSKLDDILVEDLPNAWCEECEHPVCLSRRESFKQELKDMILEIGRITMRSDHDFTLFAEKVEQL